MLFRSDLEANQALLPVVRIAGEVDDVGVQRFAGAVEVVDELQDAACLGLSDDREIARVRPDSLSAAASAAYRAEAEALFIACTALRAAGVVQRIEDRLDAPVVTSNQAMFWQTIRAAGCDLPVRDCGRLLRAH